MNTVYATPKKRIIRTDKKMSVTLFLPLEVSKEISLFTKVNATKLLGYTVCHIMQPTMI